MKKLFNSTNENYQIQWMKLLDLMNDVAWIAHLITKYLKLKFLLLNEDVLFEAAVEIVHLFDESVFSVIFTERKHQPSLLFLAIVPLVKESWINELTLLFFLRASASEDTPW